jgi:hypothetical protein
MIVKHPHFDIVTAYTNTPFLYKCARSSKGLKYPQYEYYILQQVHHGPYHTPPRTSLDYTKHYLGMPDRKLLFNTLKFSRRSAVPMLKKKNVSEIFSVFIMFRYTNSTELKMPILYLQTDIRPTV